MTMRQPRFIREGYAIYCDVEELLPKWGTTVKSVRDDAREWAKEEFELYKRLCKSIGEAHENLPRYKLSRILAEPAGC